MWSKFNPTVADFLKGNPSKTLLGLWWAFYWRVFVFIFGIYLAIAMIGVVLGIIIGVAGAF